MADEVDGTFEDVEVDHERDGECTMGSAMSARDDGEVDVVVDMVFRCVKKPWSNKQLVYNVVCRKLHRYLELLLQRVRVPIDVIFVHVWMRTWSGVWTVTRALCREAMRDAGPATVNY